MKVHRILLMGLAAAVIAMTPALAAPVHHKPSPASDQKPMSSMMPMMGGMMNQDGMMMPVIGKADHLEGRLAFLKTELKITDAQLAQWNAFADAARTSAAQMTEMMKQKLAMKPDDAKSGLPERLAMHEKQMTSHLEMLRRMSAALTPLYATFSDEQKAAADSLLCPMKM